MRHPVPRTTTKAPAFKLASPSPPESRPPGVSFPAGFFFTPGRPQQPPHLASPPDANETSLGTNRKERLPSGLFDSDEGSPPRPSPTRSSLTRRPTIAQPSLQLVQDHLDKERLSPAPTKTRTRSRKSIISRLPHPSPSGALRRRTTVQSTPTSSSSLGGPTSFIPWSATRHGVLSIPAKRPRPLPAPPTTPYSSSSSVGSSPFSALGPIVNNTGPSRATSTSPTSPNSNSSQPTGTSTTTHGAGFDAVTKELETLTRSASFARECERLAAEFVSCAKLTQVRTKDERKLAQETLVSLAQLHGEILRRLSLGHFHGVRGLVASTHELFAPTFSGMVHSDSSESLAVPPSVSTSSSSTQLDSPGFLSPARSTIDSVGTANTSVISFSPFTNSSKASLEQIPVAALILSPNRWVSRSVEHQKLGPSSLRPVVYDQRNTLHFYNAILNKVTPERMGAFSKVLVKFVNQSLADPTKYRKRPLTLLVQTFLRHVTSRGAGPEANARLAKTVAFLLFDVHCAVLHLGTDLLPSLVRTGIKPYLDSLVDKLFPPLLNSQRPTTTHSASLNSDLPSIATFLTFCHSFSTILVPSTILHEFLHLLLHTPSPTDKECLAACRLFELAGRRLEAEGFHQTDRVELAWQTMQTVVSTKRLTYRAKYALLDAIDLKSLGWMSRAWMRSLREPICY